MQTLLLKLEEPILSQIMDYLKKFPSDNYEIRNIDFNIDDDINLLEEEIAYQRALQDLKNNEAINLRDYINDRGLL